MVRSPVAMNPDPMTGDSEQGWWRASDGYWYPAEARPGQLWTGKVIGPHGEEPPGPGWWLASDYQWYPPDARPGELWLDPVASGSGRRAERLTSGLAAGMTRTSSGATPATVPGAAPATFGRRDLLLAATGVLLIVIGVVLLALVRARTPEVGTAMRLLAWSPVAVGSSVTLIGAMRYLGPTR